MSPSDSVAIVPAGGGGERLGLGAKAFLELDGKTLLELVAERLRPLVSRIVVAVPVAYLDRARRLLPDPVEVISGGATRQATVEKLFLATTEPLVLIHDVTRPFASSALIIRVLDAAWEQGAAAAMLNPHIPVGCIESGRIVRSLDRHEAMLPQSPQAFRRPVLEKAIHDGHCHGWVRQTTWQLVEMSGAPIVPVAGEETNIKITTPMDWDMAQRVVWPRISGQKDH